MTENYSFYFFNNLHIRNINAAGLNLTQLSAIGLLCQRAS